MKQFLPLVFALSIGAGPVLSWGWSDCPHSNKGANQEASNEKVEKTESSKKN